MKLKSLTRQLFVRYAMVLLSVWVVLISLAIFEFFRSGQQQIDSELRSGAQQLLAVMRALSDSPKKMRSTAVEIEKFDSSRTVVDGQTSADTEVYFQVWRRDELIFGDENQTPFDIISHQDLAREELLDRAKNKWIAWSAVDTATGTKTRLMMKDPVSLSIDSDDLGFLVLPLLVSVPFLLIPTWLVTRKSMQPLTAIGAEIDARNDIDLSPLESKSNYRELTSIIKAIDGLMLRLNERLAREKEFLSDAAHELKTPLAVINANAERVAAMNTKPELASAVTGLTQGVDRATHSIHQLVSYSRLDAGDSSENFSSANLGEIIAERLAILDNLAVRKNVSLIFHHPQKIKHAISLNAFTMMIDNLVGNAIKHAPMRSTVLVTLSAENGKFFVMVDDEGAGIPSEYREKVFERFFRLPDSPHEGSGLGLGIAESAAQMHGGNIILSDGPSGTGLRVVATFDIQQP